ncbi:uncharacterized protein FIBRA_07776 [Fibroporia radiculosa]|uniref:phosphoinositide 5-phosphatase n=1 Tax=Fibroporia radiculosa TaxID=599839 RepID=J4H4T5_9APHY|nr:uncharacterized protein FIBRA_07776 [Fibroporia radiculosa]CCM05549.1 predicted protein [Fibroporia radiculosa]
MHLYVAESPRRLYLVTTVQEERQGRPSRALVFQAADSADDTIEAQAVVQFLPRDQVDLTNAVRLTSRNIKGCLGLISVSDDIFLVVVTSSSEIGDTRPSAATPEVVAQIHEAGFYSLSSSVWDDLSGTGEITPSPGYGDQADSVMRDPYTSSSASNSLFEHPCAPLTKIISAGTFYYALEPHWDLSSRLSVRLARRRPAGTTFDIGEYDERFVWNDYIVRSLLDFRERLDAQEREDLDRCHYIILAIQGYVGTYTIPLPAPPTSGSPVMATLSLISRLGWKRSGTRFNTRGVDDDGNCANFVETETLFSTDQHCFSYAQVRGSVPLFWEQQGLQTFGHRIQITRPQASQPAFDRHMMQLIEEYGSIHAINLLGSKENEAILTAAYARHLESAKVIMGDTVGITHFDFHNAVRIGGHESVPREVKRLPSVADNVDKFGFTMTDASSDDLITDQKGAFRTNCLDCLDRTNFVQDILSRTMLEQFLTHIRREWLQSGILWGHHREVWAENGDALSRIYAGTGALNTSFTRSGKRTLAGVLSDATKSVSRAYINNFQDKGKQVAIDMLVGNLSTQTRVTIYDPIHDSVRRALEARLPEYSTTKQCTIFVGTWNLNGRPPSSESLLPWLFPRSTTVDPDIFVLGFQEIVPLTAQQIVQADPEKRRAWEVKILDTINRRPDRKSEYILLRSQQLVGTAMMVLVQSELTSVIRSVEATSQKTGLRGMSGNKGAVGIRLDYHDTSFCFITAHLAAGHANVHERNADYRTIASGLAFLKGKTIDSHENIMWLADTNYRIDLENERARFLAQSEDYDALLAADQLKQSMDEGAAFSGYQEGPLLFRPTYKYDVGTDRYDTGEKMRIPAWTVFALFRAEVRIIDQAKRADLSRLLFESVTATAPGETLDEKLAKLSFSNINSDLPTPSSDDAVWWDDPDYPNELFVSKNLKRFEGGNPFDSSDESTLSSSPSSSEEELYQTLALQSPMAPVQAARRPPPPPPSRNKLPGKEST